jgi:hypothetical protein
MAGRCFAYAIKGWKLGANFTKSANKWGILYIFLFHAGITTVETAFKSRIACYLKINSVFLDII